MESDNYITGDVDGNGEVNFTDFLILSDNFGSTDAERTDGDLDGDGQVAFADFLILSDSFSAAEPQAIVAFSAEDSQSAELETTSATQADEFFAQFEDGLALDDLA